MTPELNFEFGDTNEAKRTIRLKRTIPVGCNHTDTCKVELLARIPDGSDENQCSIIKLEGRRCGIEINSDDVLGEEIKILVTPAGTGQYIESEVYREVHLKVDVTDENRIWDNHALEPIKVSICFCKGALSCTLCFVC